MNKRLVALMLLALIAQTSIFAEETVVYSNDTTNGYSECCPAARPACTTRSSRKCCSPRRYGQRRNDRRWRWGRPYNNNNCCPSERRCRPKRQCCPRLRCCRPKPACCPPSRPRCDARPCVRGNNGNGFIVTEGDEVLNEAIEAPEAVVEEVTEVV